MNLTVKENEFVVEFAEGASQTSVYRSAYNSQNMSAKTIWQEAWRLRRHPKVAARKLSWRRKKRLGGACRRSLERIEFSKN